MATIPRPYKRGTPPQLPGSDRRYLDDELRRLEQSSALVGEALAEYAPLASPAFTGDPTAPTPAAADNDTSIATTAFVQTELADYAPLASPTFTGDPKAPTPAAADNDTSIATTAFVQTELASYAPLASPTFTGNPAAPTPSAGDNDTSIATTAFVTTAISTAQVAFHANNGGSAQTGLTSSAYNKINLSNEVEDTDGFYDNATNYRFLPTVAGLYSITYMGGSAGNCAAQIRKNGSAVLDGSYSPTTTYSIATGLVRLNGSTDYVEAYLWVDGATTTTTGSASSNYLCGFRVSD